MGDTGIFTLASTYAGAGVHALVTVEQNNNILDTRLIDVNNYKQSFMLPITHAEIPGFTVHATLVYGQSGSGGALATLQTLRASMQTLEQKVLPNPPTPCYLVYDLMPDRLCFVGNTQGSTDTGTLLQLADMRRQELSLLQQILPDYLDGSTDVHVSTDPVHLSITATPDQSTYLPGAPATITLSVRDGSGNPVNGEATLAIVDEAIFALKKDTGDILGAFYTPGSSNIFGITNLENLPHRIDFTQAEIQSVGSNGATSFNLSDTFGAVGGGAPMMRESTAAPTATTALSSVSPTSPATVRTDFKDLAYYTGSVSLVNGTATISVASLPDDLTKWRIVGYAFDANTNVGDFSGSLSTTKPLSIVPSIPQAFVSGDDTELSATLLNQTNTSITVRPTLTISHATITSLPSSTVSLPANSSTSVTWKVHIDSMPTDIDWSRYTSAINITAVADGTSDALDLTRVIRPYSTPEYTLTTGTETGSVSYADKIILPSTIDPTQGRLDITLAASELAHLPQDWSVFADMPSDDAYSLLRLLSIAATLHRLATDLGDPSYYTSITVVDRNGITHTLDNIAREALAQVSTYVQPDGGLAYARTCEPWVDGTCSDFELSGRYLRVAYDLTNEGFPVDSSITDNVLTYYTTTLNKNITYTHNHKEKYTDIDPFYVLANYPSATDTIRTNLPEAMANTKTLDPADIATLILTLKKSGLFTNQIPGLVNTIKNNLFIEARGTFLPPDVVSTARGLSALLTSGDTDGLTTDNMIRWLIAMRDTDGQFGSDVGTMEALSAIADYVQATGDGRDADFTATGILNNNPLISHTFSSDNRFETATGAFGFSGNLLTDGQENLLGFTKS